MKRSTLFLLLAFVATFFLAFIFGRLSSVRSSAKTTSSAAAAVSLRSSSSDQLPVPLLQEANLDGENGRRLLKGAFNNEGFRLEKKRIVPGTAKWRFCAPLPAYASSNKIGPVTPIKKRKALLLRLAAESAESGRAALSKETGLLMDESRPQANPLCPTSSFFVVHQQMRHSDNIVPFLERAEQHVIDLFNAILSTTLRRAYLHFGGLCMRPNDGSEDSEDCFVTAGDFSKRQREQERKLVVFDIGSNHGFYSLLALGSAPSWLSVFAIEPQPECFSYVSLALQASGFSHSSHVFNALAGRVSADDDGAAEEDNDRHHRSTEAVTKTLHFGELPFVIPAPSKHREAVPLRTGCRGTFPAITKGELEDVKGYFQSTLGFDPTVKKIPVGFVDPSKILPSRDTVVILAKIDVEGFEGEVLSALEPMLKEGRIANIIIEFNKAQKWRRLNQNREELPPFAELNQDPAVVSWIVDLLSRLQGHGYVLVPSFTGFRNEPALSTDPAALNEFAMASFLSVDIWCYLPASKVHGLPPAHSADE